jgi:Ankyrin repeats (3 copies)/Ankyrin repeat
MDPTAPDAGNPIEQVKRAFHTDDPEQVRAILERHPELTARIDDPIGPFDSPAIVNARSPAMVDVLLSAGADLNAKSRWWAGGFGILHTASPELAAYAIARGAVVDAHAAARLGMMEKLHELISADPRLVHARGGDGQTPLHFAKTVEIAAFLLDHGAEIDAKDVDHESTPAQYMTGDRQEVTRFLIGRGCRTDLLMASAVGDVVVVGRHLDADPNSIRMCVSDEYFPMIRKQAGGSIYQWTLGFYASAHQVARKFDRPDVLALLDGRSPPVVKLIEACWQSDAAAVRRLRNEHSDIATGLTEADLRQAAHAARNNETEVVRLMLESGLPVDARSQHQATALHWAGFHGNLEMTKVVLRHNPPLEAKDADFDGTPLGWAIHGSKNGWNCRTGDYAGTVEALIQAGAKVPDELGGAPAVQEVLRRHASSASR